VLCGMSETFPIMCLQSIGRITLADIDHVRPIYDAAFTRGQSILCSSDARMICTTIEVERPFPWRSRRRGRVPAGTPSLG
jgi:hypothetical protein